MRALNDDVSPRGRAAAVRSGGTSGWAGHAVEAAFVGVMAGAFVSLFRVTRKATFVGDDWGLLHQGQSLAGLFEPYNDHMSVTILGLYRALIEVFGFSYAPFRVAGMVCLLSVPTAFFLTTRRSLGAPLAAASGLSMLAFTNLELIPANLNHYLALVGGIGCAAALNRGPRPDWILAASLCLALSAAGGGLPVAAACLVHNLCTRATPHRWIAVVGPTAAWAMWWLLVARDSQSRFAPTSRPPLSEALRYARTIVLAPFEHMTLGVPFLGGALAVAFLALGGVRLRAGLASGANFLAWASALVVWAVGLAYGRGSVAGVVVDASQRGVFYRYELLALGFALLAIVPARKRSADRRAPVLASPRSQVVAAAAILGASLAIAMAMRDEVDAKAARLAAFARFADGELLVVELGPEAVPDRTTTSSLLSILRASDVRALRDRYDEPPTDLATVDAQVVRLDLVAIRQGGRRPSACPAGAERTWLLAPPEPLRLWVGKAARVEVRRFATEWIEVASVTEPTRLVVEAPALASAVPWQVRAEGACPVPP